MDKLQKRYGLLTAICMVVGIVIGSGVFFKAQTIRQKTGGNIKRRMVKITKTCFCGIFYPTVRRAAGESFAASRFSRYGAGIFGISPDIGISAFL